MSVHYKSACVTDVGTIGDPQMRGEGPSVKKKIKKKSPEILGKFFWSTSIEIGRARATFIEWRLSCVLVFTSWRGRPSLSVDVKWEDRQEEWRKKTARKCPNKQTGKTARIFFFRAVIDDVQSRFMAFPPCDKKSIFTRALIGWRHFFVCVDTSAPAPSTSSPVTSSCSSRTLSSIFVHQHFVRSSISLEFQIDSFLLIQISNRLLFLISFKFKFQTEIL